MLDVAALTRFQSWLHAEDILDEATYDAFLPRIDEEWQQRFSTAEHNGLSVMPQYLEEDARMDNAMTLGNVARGDVTMSELEADGRAFRKTYLADAQYVFSRVQHHVHLRTKRGYEPLKACAKKTKKKSKCMTCKADFPKVKLCIPHPRVVCRGLAKKFGLRVTGRRNAFGAIIGRRRCQWQSATTPSFAVIFRSNTHTMPNYRVPLLPETHDAACPSKACAAHVLSHADTKIISKLAQRVQREATGYYCGYAFKRQPVGTKHLRAVGETLNYVTAGMEDKTSGQRWHRMTHRVLVDFQHRCMTRTAPEEWNLAANWQSHDVKAAEFLRTYRSDDFPGGQLVRRLEAETRGATEREVSKVIPARKVTKAAVPGPLLLKDFTDLYGYRGQDQRVFLLNPWEFLMLWEVVPLPKPSGKPGSLTVWTTRASANTGEREYDVNPAAEKADEDSVFYPILPGDVQLRKKWYMRRRRRPMVPAPANTPMPDKAGHAEGKARLLSLYMRPWVLERVWATAVVPHIADLDLQTLPSSEPASASASRNYTGAWRHYVRGRVVTHHAKRLVVQFMAACCGKSSAGRDLDPAEEAAGRQLKEMPANELPLQRVHGILDRMSLAAEDEKVVKRPRAEETGSGSELSDAADQKALKKSTQMQGAMDRPARTYCKSPPTIEGKSIHKN